MKVQIMKINDLYAYHYYEKEYGPCACILEIPYQDAILINHKNMKTEVERLYYMKQRLMIERNMRAMFIKKGGLPRRNNAFYFTVGRNDFIGELFVDWNFVEIPISEFDPKTITFTYCDSFHAFKRKDDHFTKRKVYTIYEIDEVIDRCGWNFGEKKIPYYIEMQVWDDTVLKKYSNNVHNMKNSNLEW
ncbi:MAG: hypothetical protein N3I35_16150 [Clostridia bacterium]|nr:hypothetical protein [Clostridia bacterium]